MVIASVLIRTDAALRARPEPDGVIEAQAEAGAILWLERCRTGWCRVEAEGERGWVPANTLWGIYDRERDPAEEPAGGDHCTATCVEGSTRLSD